MNVFFQIQLTLLMNRLIRILASVDLMMKMFILIYDSGRYVVRAKKKIKHKKNLKKYSIIAAHNKYEVCSTSILRKNCTCNSSANFLTIDKMLSLER